MESRRSLSLHIVAFGVFSALCYFGATVIVTIVLAILTAYVLDPLVNWMRRIHIPKTIAIGISMIAVTVLIVAVLTLFISRVQDFTENFPRYKSKIQKVTSSISKRILAIERRSQDISKTIIPKAGPSQPKPLVVEQTFNWREFLFGNFGHYLIQVSFFPFLVYFLLNEKASIRNFVTRLLQGRTQLSKTLVAGTAERIVNEISNNVRGFAVGYLISTTLVFIFSWLLFMAFQVEDAPVWAFIFALFNILPFVGALLSMIAPLMIAIIQFTSVEKALLLIGVCVALHLVYANFLLPRTTGPRIALSPLVILLSMMYWGFLWGAIGIFLATPLTACMRSVWVQYQALRFADEEAA
jgi:predicted PurR-regulated permease PerM